MPNVNGAILLPGQLPQFGSDLSLVSMKTWLPINEKAGSRLNNMIDSLNPGIMTGGSWAGNGVSLGGTDDIITMNRIANLTDWTVIMRYTPTGVSGEHPIIDQGDILVKQNAANIIYGATDNVYSDSTDTLTAALTADTPIDLIITRSGTTITIWGFSQGASFTDSFTVSGTALTALTNLIIGANSRTAFVFPALTGDLSGENGLLITASDDVQFPIGSLSLDSAAVGEGLNANQGSLEFIIGPNWDGDDGLAHLLFDTGVSSTTNRIALYKNSDNNVYLSLWDTDSTTHNLSGSSSSWSAGTPVHIVATWDWKNDTAALYVDGSVVDNTPAPAMSSDSITALEGTFSLGSSRGGTTNNLNAVIYGRILDRPLSAAEVTALYAAGAGHLDSTVVTPDVRWRPKFPDSDTGAIFWHKGQKISSISTVTLTLTEAVGSRSWAAGKLVVVQDDDNPPNIVRSTISSASGSTIVLDDSAAAITGTNKHVSMNLIADGDMELGNTGAYAAGDGGTTLSKSTVEIFKDTQSLKVLNGDGTQAFARQTITTVAGADYWFHGRYFAAATLNGASQLVDVDATAALGVTVTQAGLSAGWNTVEFAFEAGDTSTDIDLGSGSVTNTEFGYWDDVQIRENLIVNGGMEGVYVAGVAPGWVNRLSGTLTEENSIVHSGGAAQKNVTAESGRGVQQTITVVIDKYYTVRGWINVTVGGEIVRAGMFLQDAVGDDVDKRSDVTPGTGWNLQEHTFKATTTSLIINFIAVQAGDHTFYVDDVSLIQVDEVDASTATRTRDFGSGDIGRLKIWDRALTLAEVQEYSSTPYEVVS